MSKVERVALNDLDVPDPRIKNVGWDRPYVERNPWEVEHHHTYQEHGGPHAYIQHLASDIREHGLEEHIEIGRDGKLVDGHHRIWAARAAGLTHITALRHDR